jgi:hypothetical protein
MVISSRYCIHGIDMVAKQLPQATFRISDNELWESFKAKAKTNGTNASAVFWQFAKDYVDGNLDSRIDCPAAPDVDIQAMIDDALNSKIKELREEFEEHEAIYQAQCQKGFELQISTFRDEMNEAIEAIATAKKPLLSVMREKLIAA